MISGLAVVTLGLLCLVWGDRAMDRILKRTLEDATTRTLGVDVTIGDVELSLLDGALAFENLEIANPEGYQGETLLSLKHGAILLDVSSLLSDRVEITSIAMDRLQILWEQKGGRNNLQDLIKQFPPRDPEQTSSKSLHIQVLEMNQAVVEAQLLPLPGQMSRVTMQLPTIRLTHLGAQDALDLEALTRQIISALITCILEQGVEEFPSTLMSPLRQTVQSGVEWFKDAVHLDQGIQNFIPKSPPERP